MKKFLPILLLLTLAGTAQCQSFGHESDSTKIATSELDGLIIYAGAFFTCDTERDSLQGVNDRIWRMFVDERKKSKRRGWVIAAGAAAIALKVFVIK